MIKVLSLLKSLYSFDRKFDYKIKSSLNTNTDLSILFHERALYAFATINNSLELLNVLIEYYGDNILLRFREFTKEYNNDRNELTSISQSINNMSFKTGALTRGSVVDITNRRNEYFSENSYTLSDEVINGNFSLNIISEKFNNIPQDEI